MNWRQYKIENAPFAYRKVALILVVLSLSAGCTLEPAGRAEVNEAQEIGERIVVALESYKAKYGEYPTTLDGLVPEFLTKLDQPSYGTRQWEYGSSENRYRLAFGSFSSFESLFERGERSHDWSEDSK